MPNKNLCLICNKPIRQGDSTACPKCFDYEKCHLECFIGLDNEVDLSRALSDEFKENKAKSGGKLKT